MGMHCYCKEPVTLENLEKFWLMGTTCQRYKSVHWVSDDGQWIVMKHHGHTGYAGRQYCSSRCGVYYDLFRVGDPFPDALERSMYFRQEGRWSKESMKWVEKVMAGWRPDNFRGDSRED